MMKKRYIKPEMQGYEVGTQQLLAASGTKPEPGVSLFSNESPDDDNEDMW